MNKPLIIREICIFDMKQERKIQGGMAVWLTPDLVRRVEIVKESEGDERVAHTTRRLLREILEIRDVSDSGKSEDAPTQRT